MAKREERVHLATCRYIRHQYPNVMFSSESSGVRLPIGLAKIVKQQRHPATGLPDLMIFHPNRKFHGLFLELKSSRDQYVTKSGNLRNTKHIKEQHEVHVALRKLGYRAVFVGGIDEAIEEIDNYMKIPVK